MKKYKIITLGCKVNQYESNVYKDQLKKLGCTEEKNPDFIIINSCSVTQKSEKESIFELLKAKKKHPFSKIYFTGCAYQNENLEDAFVIPNSEKENLVNKIFPKRKISEFSCDKFYFQTRAFLKIQDGCDNFCSYCIIPKTRGRSRSRPFKDIICEAKNLIKNGHKEIVVTGINISDYKDGDKRLSDLLSDLCKIDEDFRIRLSSLEIKHQDDHQDEHLLDVIINEKKICPHIHLVLQSGSDKILKKMGRKYSKEDFLYAVDKLKEKKDITFSTDVIIGFPYEEDEDFQKTIEVIKKVQFLKVHIFSFSKRKNTKAYFFKEIPKEIVYKRKKVILDLSYEISKNVKKRFIEKKMRVLLEKPFFGHSDNFLPVVIDKKLKKGSFCNVFIKDLEKDDLKGDIYED